MADLRQVEVIFKVGGGETAEKKPSEKIKSGTKNKVQEQKTDYVGATLVSQAWGYVKADITKIANYEINKWFSLNDDYIGQRNLTNALNVVNRAKNTAASIAAGIVLGGAVGGVIAAVGSFITLGIDIAQNIDRQNIALRQMDAQLSYQRQRAGYSLTSGRIGEDK